MLTVELRHRQAGFALDVAFASGGRLTALHGASGSGKTTVVNLVAGLLRPEAGRIEIDGRVLLDTARGIDVPPHRRRLGYVFQDARLLPHLSVRQNLLYGRFFTPPAERRAEPEAVVELLGIGHLLERRPGTLSGGEGQRVAIGRALLASPRLLLMDEPLASLDEARKAEILPYIERLRDEAGVPIVYVSHSLAEVTRLASDVVLLQAGRAVASGPAAEVLARYDLLQGEDRDEAGSLLDLTVAAHQPDGLTLLRAPGGSAWRLPLLEEAVGSVLRVRVRARDVMLATERPVGISALNVQAGRIAGIVPGGQRDALVTVACGSDRILARITAYSVSALGLAEGREVLAIVKAVTFADRNQPHARPKGA